MSNLVNQQQDIVFYSDEDETFNVEVLIKDEDVWLNAESIAKLFKVGRPAITKQINNIYNDQELEENSTCSILEHMGNRGNQKYKTKYYNLDMIISLGFSGNSKDPSSIIYDGLEIAKKDNYDLVLIDTAGRLQNKSNLMDELSKINRVIKKVIPSAPHETLLVIDATTGQNGISQAKSFKEITDITGIVLTKLDGTAKGGIVLAIKEEVNIPVKFVGLGEKVEQIEAFDIEKYIYGLFKDL